MTRISARGTRFAKLAIPAFFIGLTAYAAITGLGPDHEHPAYLWPIALFMVVGMVLFERHMLRDLADEVLDAGDSLVVTHQGTKFTVHLAEIERVDEISDRPPRIAIVYRTPQGLKSLVFSPAESFIWPFLEKSRIAKDLQERIGAASINAPPPSDAA